jgi:hypothetical protein
MLSHTGGSSEGNVRMVATRSTFGAAPEAPDAVATTDATAATPTHNALRTCDRSNRSAGRTSSHAALVATSAHETAKLSQACSSSSCVREPLNVRAVGR